MDLLRRIFLVILATAVVTSCAVCFSQAAKKDKDIYNESADARAEIKEALQKAATEHKRVIVVFGANWCYDCHVLDKAFHSSELAPILAANYEVVHVDIGKGDKNQDLMTKYDVPMKRGIPGLAVLDPDGTLVYSQKNGEFENARALAPADFLSFLNKWKPGAQSQAR
jgi:thioredoxin 1